MVIRLGAEHVAGVGRDGRTDGRECVSEGVAREDIVIVGDGSARGYACVCPGSTLERRDSQRLFGCHAGVCFGKMRRRRVAQGHGRKCQWQAEGSCTLRGGA